MRRGYWFIPKHLFGRAGGHHRQRRARTCRCGSRSGSSALLLRIINGDPTRLGLPKPDHKLFETHPAINSMLIHHLQHGDITAKPGIARTEGRTVRLHRRHQRRLRSRPLGTGYVHKVPVRADGTSATSSTRTCTCRRSRREHQGLFGIGFVETNSGAYQLFDTQAQLIAGYVHDARHRLPNAERFARMIRADRPDLSGGLQVRRLAPPHRLCRQRGLREVPGQGRGRDGLAYPGRPPPRCGPSRRGKAAA